MKALLTINTPLSNVSIIGRIKESDIKNNYDCLVSIPGHIVDLLNNVHFDVRAIDTGLSRIEINPN